MAVNIHEKENITPLFFKRNLIDEIIANETPETEPPASSPSLTCLTALSVDSDSLCGDNANISGLPPPTLQSAAIQHNGDNLEHNRCRIAKSDPKVSMEGPTNYRNNQFFVE